MAPAAFLQQLAKRKRPFRPVRFLRRRLSGISFVDDFDDLRREHTRLAAICNPEGSSTPLRPQAVHMSAVRRVSLLCNHANSTKRRHP